MANGDDKRNPFLLNKASVSEETTATTQTPSETFQDPVENPFLLKKKESTQLPQESQNLQQPLDSAGSTSELDRTALESQGQQIPTTLEPTPAAPPTLEPLVSDSEIDLDLQRRRLELSKFNDALAQNEATISNLDNQILDPNIDDATRELLNKEKESILVKNDRIREEFNKASNEESALQVKRRNQLTPEQLSEETDVGALQGFINALKRGFSEGSVVDIINVNGGIPTEEEFKEIARIKREQANLPSSKPYQDFLEAENIDEAVSELIKNPIEIVSQLTGESMATMLRHGSSRAAAGAASGALSGSVIPGIGTAVGIGTGVIAGMVAAGANMEVSGSILESLQEAGIDITDPESLKKGFENKELMDEARSHAHKRAVPIAIFDMVSGGIAGSILKKPAKSLLKKVGKTALESATQVSLAGAGEVSAQLLADGKVTPTEILAEMLGEIGGGAPEIAIGTAIKAKKFGKSAKKALVQQNKTKEEFNDDVNISEAAGDITPEQADELRQDHADIERAKNAVPEEFKNNEEVVLNIEKKQKLQDEQAAIEEEEANTDPAFQAKFAPRKQEIQTQINEIDGQISILFEEETDVKAENPLPNLDVAIERDNVEYKIGDQFFSEKEIIDQLGNKDFVKEVQDGIQDLTISNPSEKVIASLEKSGLLTENQLETIKPEEDAKTETKAETETKVEPETPKAEDPTVLEETKIEPIPEAEETEAEVDTEAEPDTDVQKQRKAKADPSRGRFVAGDIIPESDFESKSDKDLGSFTKREKERDTGGVFGIDPGNQFKLNQGPNFDRVHVLLSNNDADRFRKGPLQDLAFNDQVKKLARQERSVDNEVVLDLRERDVDVVDAKIKEIDDKIAAAKEKFRKSLGSVATTGGLNPQTIEAIGELAGLYLQKGTLKTAQVIKNVISDLKDLGVTVTEDDVKNVIGDAEDVVEDTPKPKKTPKKAEKKPKAPKEKVSKVSERLIKSGTLSEDQAIDLEERSKFRKASNEEDLKTSADLISAMGSEQASKFVNDVSNAVNPQVRKAVNIDRALSLRDQARKENDPATKKALEQESNNLFAFESLENTKAGQETQFVKALLDKHPELRVMDTLNSKIIADRNEKLASDDVQQGKTAGEVIDDTRSSLESEIKDALSNMQKLIEENKKLRDIIDNANKTRSKTGIEARKAKARKKISNALEKIRKNAGKSATVGGLNNEAIEGIGELIVGYVELGALNTAQVVKKVVSDLKKIGVDASEEDVRSVAKDINEFKSAQTEEIERGDDVVKKEVEKAIKNQDIKKIAKDYFLNPMEATESLADKFVEDLGLDQKEAESLSKALKDIISDKVKEVLDNQLIKDLTIKPEMTKEEKEARSQLLRENNKLINKVVNTIALGGLNTENFVNDFSEKYGFTGINSNIINELTNLVSAIQNFEKKGFTELKRKSEVRLNSLLDSLKEKDLAFYANLMRELDYAGILSGVNTQLNAGIGASGTTIVNWSASAISEIARGNVTGLVRAIARSLSPSNLKASLSLAKEAARINHNKFSMDGYFDYKESSNRTTGALERQVLKGVMSYLKSVKESKTITEGMKNTAKLIGQSLLQFYRMNMLLTAQDAFITGINSEYNIAINEYNKAVKDLKLKPLERIFSNKKILEKIDKDRKVNSPKDAIAQAEKEFDDVVVSVSKEVDSDIENGFVLPKNRSAEVNKRMTSLLGSSVWRNFISRNKKGGKFRGYINRRAVEIQNENLDRDLYEKSVNTSKDWIAMYEPDGLPGILHQSFKRVTTIKTGDGATVIPKIIASFLIKFSRITAWTVNSIQSNIPIVGIIPSVIGINQDKSIGLKHKSNKELVKRRIFMNLLTTGLGTALFQSMFNWDDEGEQWELDPDRLIDITATGFGEWSKNIQAEEGRQDFAVRFRNSSNDEWSPYRSVKYVPYLMPITGVLGRLSDDIKGFDSEEKLKAFKDRSKFNQVINFNTMANMPLNAMMEGSFNSLGRTTKKILRAEDESEAFGNAMFEVIVLPSRSISQPAMFRDIFNAFRSDEQNNRKDAKTASERMLKDYYGLDYFLQDQTDMFGNPIPKQGRISQWTDGQVKMSKTHKELNLIYKFPTMNIPMYRGTDRISKKRGGKSYVVVTDEAKRFLVETQKKEFKRLVLDRFDKLNNLNEYKLDKKLRELRGRAIDFSKKETINKFKGTDNIKIKE